MYEARFKRKMFIGRRQENKIEEINSKSEYCDMSFKLSLTFILVTI